MATKDKDVSTATPKPYLSPRASQVQFAEQVTPKFHEPHAAEDELHVQMTVRGDRLLAGALFVAATLVSTMALLHGGKQIYHYSNGIPESKRKDKLDEYNSRSGSIVAVFEYPIGAMAGVLLSVIVLTFAKRFVLVSNPSYETRLGLVLVSFGLAYTLTSGLSALNIELENDVPRIRMNSTDLVARTVLSQEQDPKTSGYNNSWVERGPDNRITNTVLRSAVRPFKMRPPKVCTAAPKYFSPSLITSSFGFRLSTWQSSVFEEALDQEYYSNNSFKIYMNATKQQMLTGKQPATLPMNMSLAQNLFVNSLMFSYSWVKWWSVGIDFPKKMEQKFTEKFGNRTMDEFKRNPNKMTATEVFDLKPPSGVDPVDHFVKRARAMLNESLTPQVNASFIASSIEFKSTKLSDEVTMDAITYELPMWKGYLSRSLKQRGGRLVSQGLDHSPVANITKRTDEWEAEQEARTVYYEINRRDDCGPHVPACLIESDEYSNGKKMVPEHRIRAIGACVNDEGTEEVQFQETTGPRPGSADTKEIVMRMPSCVGKASNAFYVSSFSYRIVGDAMVDSPLPNIDPDEDKNLTSHRAVIVNPRKIYSFTIARISWNTVDLAEKFHVECEPGADCQGLSHRIDQKGSTKSHVLVRKSSLPLASLQPYEYAEPFFHVQFVSGVPLVATPIMLNVVGTVFTDYALGHNFKTVKWPNAAMKGDNCSFYAERGLITNVDNHYYMEGTLQPVYTTAFFSCSKTAWFVRN